MKSDIAENEIANLQKRLDSLESNILGFLQKIEQRLTPKSCGLSEEQMKSLAKMGREIDEANNKILKKMGFSDDAIKEMPRDVLLEHKYQYLHKYIDHDQIYELEALGYKGDLKNMLWYDAQEIIERKKPITKEQKETLREYKYKGDSNALNWSQANKVIKEIEPITYMQKADLKALGYMGEIPMENLTRVQAEEHIKRLAKARGY